MERTKYHSILTVSIVFLLLFSGTLVYIIVKQNNDIKALKEEIQNISLSQEKENNEVDVEIAEQEKPKQTTMMEYLLENPKLKFSYPSNYKVSISNDSIYVTVKIEAEDSYLQIKMFESVGGPGTGTTFETKNLGSVSIGEILGNKTYRTQTATSSYIYSNEPIKCIDKAKCEIYSPECTCKDINNYAINSLQDSALTWSPSLGGTTYINLVIEGNPTEEELKSFDNLVISLKPF